MSSTDSSADMSASMGESAAFRQLLHSVIRERAHQVVRCPVTVQSVDQVSESFVRVRVAGEGLRGIEIRPADAFKLNLPPYPGAPTGEPDYDDRGAAVWPSECAEPPDIRCFTVVSSDQTAGTLTFDVLMHPRGAATRWLAELRPDDAVPLTGWRTEFVVAPRSTEHLLVADPSAIPAVTGILQLLEPLDHRVQVIAELAAGDRHLVPPADVHWADDADAVRAAVAELGPIGPRTQVWICGETSLVRDVRRAVLGPLGAVRDQVHAAGYWKRGLDWDETFAESLDRFHTAGARGDDVSDPGVLQSLAFD